MRVAWQAKPEIINPFALVVALHLFIRYIFELGKDGEQEDQPSSDDR